MVLAAPMATALTWLQLDDPPDEGPGDSLRTVAFSDGFEAGNLNLWTEGGAAKWDAVGSRKHSGAWAAFANAGGGATSTLTSQPIDVSGSGVRALTFWWQMGAGTNSIRFAVDIYDGSWREDALVYARPYADNTWRLATVDLAPYAPTSTLQVRFEFGGNSGLDRIWIDDIDVVRDHPSADLVDLYFSNDGVYLYLRETLAATPDPARYTYTIFIDKPADGAVDPDFRVIFTQGTNVLQKWNVSQWETVEGIQVEMGSDDITFRIPLAAIANPDLLEDIDLHFANLLGSMANPSPAMRAPPPSPPPGVDHAADEGKIHIPRQNVPQIPLMAAPAFAAALGLAIFLGLRRFGIIGGRGRR
jgi:hypothetical protein